MFKSTIVILVGFFIIGPLLDIISTLPSSSTSEHPQVRHLWHETIKPRASSENKKLLERINRAVFVDKTPITEKKRARSTERRQQQRPSSAQRGNENAMHKDELSIYPWARYHMRPLTVTPDPSTETSLFWHIPKVSYAFSLHYLHIW